MLLIGSGGSKVCTGKEFSLVKQRQSPVYKQILLQNSIGWLFATWNIFSFINQVIHGGQGPRPARKIIKPIVQVKQYNISRLLKNLTTKYNIVFSGYLFRIAKNMSLLLLVFLSHTPPAGWWGQGCHQLEVTEWPKQGLQLRKERISLGLQENLVRGGGQRRMRAPLVYCRLPGTFLSWCPFFSPAVSALACPLLSAGPFAPIVHLLPFLLQKQMLLRNFSHMPVLGASTQHFGWVQCQWTMVLLPSNQMRGKKLSILFSFFLHLHTLQSKKGTHGCGTWGE